MTNLPPTSGPGITNAAVFEQRTLPICQFLPRSNDRFQRVASVSDRLKKGREYGKGNFDPFCEYGGTDFTLVGNDIFCIYSGEFWRGGGQANQIFHYRLDGTFLGQFGTPAVAQTMLSAPGAANNMFTISPVKNGATIYLYTNDEGSRGTHRWKVTASP